MLGCKVFGQNRREELFRAYLLLEMLLTVHYKK